MRHATRLLVLVGTLAIPATLIAKGKPQPVTCPPDAVAAIEAMCPCVGTWKNHGQYVRCVVHARNMFRRGGCLTADQRTGLARCAARSTCGKPDAVVCCPVAPGTCTNGTCANNSAVSCHVDTDCATRPGHVTRDAATCDSNGGTSDGAGSVCHSACSPSGAFLDVAS